MKIHLISLWVLFSSISLGSQQIVVQDNDQAGQGDTRNFGLVANGSVVDLLVDASDSKTVRLAARLFSEDIERVTGQRPKIKNSVKSAASAPPIVTLGASLRLKVLPPVFIMVKVRTTVPLSTSTTPKSV